MISIHYGYILFLNRRQLLSQKIRESSGLLFLFQQVEEVERIDQKQPLYVSNVLSFLSFSTERERMIGACVCLCGSFERGCAR